MHIHILNDKKWLYENGSINSEIHPLIFLSFLSINLNYRPLNQLNVHQNIFIYIKVNIDPKCVIEIHY
jgi:hypothetical protein